MLDTIRTTLHKVISTPVGDGFAPLRIQKDVARRLNSLLGRPLCSSEELQKRKDAETRLVALRKSGVKKVVAREPAPVTIYFEKDRSARQLARIEETLAAKGIRFKKLDVANDEATMDFVTRTAKCEKDELPIVFVAETPVGGYEALVAADVSGELHKAIFG